MRQFNLNEYLANPQRKIVTRDGRDVRIICTDADCEECPIVALVKDKSGEGHESILSFTEKGEFYTTIGLESSADLFFTPIEHEGWINIFTYTTSTMKTDGSVYGSYEEAKDFMKNSSDAKYYTTTVKIEWEE